MRLDFFGDTLESIRTFDPETQRTVGAVARARSRADERVAAHDRDDPPLPPRLCRANSARRARGDTLYEAVSEGRRAIRPRALAAAVSRRGSTRCSTMSADAPIALDALAEEAAHERFAQIADYYQARKSAPTSRTPPTPTTSRCRRTALSAARRMARAPRRAAPLARLTPVRAAGRRGDVDRLRRRELGRNFAPERHDENANVFEAAAAHVQALRGAGKRVIVAGWSDGSRERLSHVLAEHGLKPLEPVSSWAQAQRLPRRRAAARRDRARAAASRPPISRSSASRTFSATAWCAGAQAQARARRISSPRPPRCRPAISSSMSITASAASSA